MNEVSFHAGVLFVISASCLFYNPNRLYLCFNGASFLIIEGESFSFSSWESTWPVSTFSFITNFRQLSSLRGS